MPELSVIIPTRNRPEILRQCLTHLQNQTVLTSSTGVTLSGVEGLIEVIVVHDGKDDAETQKIINADWQIPVRYFTVEKSQQGIARNEGIKHASAPLTLFIGDDMFLDPKACELHLKCHGEHSRTMATLGFVTWDPAVDITPVMKWLEQSGWQFGYAMIKKYEHGFLPKEIQHRFTYTSQISLPTEVAKLIPFRKDVIMYGWEDVEWGMRLRDAGVQLFYEPDAKALHHHKITLENSLKRMQTLGKAAAHFRRDLPEFDRLPKGLKRIAYTFASFMPTMAGKHRKAFLKGIKKK